MTALPLRRGDFARVRDAKATLSAPVEKSADGDAAIITRRGKPRTVVLGIEDRLRESFGRLLLSAPWKTRTCRHAQRCVILRFNAQNASVEYRPGRRSGPAGAISGAGRMDRRTLAGVLPAGGDSGQDIRGRCQTETERTRFENGRSQRPARTRAPSPQQPGAKPAVRTENLRWRVEAWPVPVQTAALGIDHRWTARPMPALGQITLRSRRVNVRRTVADRRRSGSAVRRSRCAPGRRSMHRRTCAGLRRRRKSRPDSSNAQSAPLRASRRKGNQLFRHPARSIALSLPRISHFAEFSKYLPINREA